MSPDDWIAAENEADQYLFIAPPAAVRLLKIGNFRGLFDAELMALGGDRDVSATFVFLNTHNLKKPEICLLRATSLLPQRNSGEKIEGNGGAWPSGRASSFRASGPPGPFRARFDCRASIGLPASLKSYDKKMGAFDESTRGLTAHFKPSRCWSDRRQTGQQDVSEGFGVAHAIEASNLDQLASEDGLKGFVTVKIDRKIVFFDRVPCRVKSFLQNRLVKWVQLVSKRSEQNPSSTGCYASVFEAFV